MEGINSVRSQVIDIVPEMKGWRVCAPDGGSRVFSSIGEAAAALPEDATVDLSLPVHLLLLERMKLPSVDENELAGMAQLQLEKALSFPVHEVSFGILVVERSENVSTLLCVAVRQTALEILCAPLRDRGLYFEKITPYASRVAAACPSDETVLCIYAEDELPVLAISHRARLAWAHALPSRDAEALIGELPQTLLTAEIEGAPIDFSRIFLAASCNSWRDALGDYFPNLIERLPLDGLLPNVGIDLVPLSWRATAERRRRGARLKQTMLTAGAIYLAVFIGAFVYIGWLKSRIREIDAENASIRPQVEALQTSQARWQAMEPAIDPDRATVELLYQLWKNLPENTLHLTEFDQTVMQWKVFGEAPSANLAIEYLRKLKNDKELSDFHISASPPALLPNEQAQFNIFGKR